MCIASCLPRNEQTLMIFEILSCEPLKPDGISCRRADEFWSFLLQVPLSLKKKFVGDKIDAV